MCPCWYNICEDCTEWTVESLLTCSIDTDNKKEGLASVKIHTPHAEGEGGKSAVLPMTLCDNYLGMWLRADILTTVSLIEVWIMDSSGNKAIIQFLNMPPDNIPQWRVGAQNNGEGASFKSPVNYINKSWIWFEFLIDAVTHQITAYADGVTLGGFSGYNLTNPVQIAHIGYPSYNSTDLWFDLIRVFPTEKYPPITIPQVNTLEATNIQDSSAILNGEIVDVGEEDCDERGFDWGIATGVYTEEWTETGSFGVEAFSHTIDLSGETLIFFRAKARNSVGWGYGSEESFSPYRIIITNAGGTLHCDGIGWEENQTCKPAIRDVIKDSNGSVVDTGTYVISNRVIECVVRLSDAQLAILNVIFAQNAIVTLTAKTEMTEYPRWVYTVWFAKPFKKYEIKKEGSIEREWNVQLVFYCSSFTYMVSA
jgi:hypothetical protein